MNIETRIVADSINPAGVRLTSFILKYPRIIHQELLTHRVFSRNSASSRAIPSKKLLELVQTDPAMPEFWGKNQAGMQAAEQLAPPARAYAIECWLAARDQAIVSARLMMEAGVHKQIANRLLEPWMHMTVLVTATEFHNFFSLRAHKDAQPEFQVLGYRMLGRYLKSKPVLKQWGEWHFPFPDKIEGLDEVTQTKVSTARCARLSYLTFDGEFSVEKDIALHDNLLVPGHMSPFEHSAQATTGADYSNFGPFSNWQQYRKMIPNESRATTDLLAVMGAKADWITLEEDSVLNP